MMNKLTDLPGNSRIWIYASHSNLSESQVRDIENRIDMFLKTWNAHGKEMESGFDIFYNRFLILAANENITEASGCSIDKSTAVFKEIDAFYQLGLFERSTIFFESNNEINSIHFTHLDKAIVEGRLQDKTIVYDTTVKTIDELLEKFRTTLENTWMKRYLKNGKIFH